MLLAGVSTGVEVSILELARALCRRRACEVCLFVPEHSPFPDLSGPRFSTRRVPLVGASRAVRVLWEHVRLRAVVNHGPFDALHAPGYVAPLGLKKPLIVTIHDLFALTRPAWCSRLNRDHFRALIPPAVRRAARVIVPSESTRKALAEVLPSSRGKTSVIPFGVRDDLARVRNPVRLAAVREKYRLPGRFILFVGNLEPRKNLPGILRAFQAYRESGLDPVDLVLVGRRRFGVKVCRLTRRLRVDTGLHSPGYVADEDLAAIYSMARVFFFPTLDEGFGFPVLEAMACGVPVVASDRGALPEVAGDAAVFIDPADVGAMAAALTRVLGDADLRAEMVARGSKRVESYTWENAARLTEQVYRECGQ
jgi:glycosyltransferase involved in cell wall biosynthesis